ncbi:MAG: DNA polymerase III subunit delta' [Clostridia bacterium]|nr:DNA polymerase III subunit delta' [Clostridia bacterium]
MSLKGVIGQNRMIQTLQFSLQEGNVFHAYIFEGAEGIGKKFTAFNFAKAILCHEKEETCNQCSACKKMDHGNHPDYHFIEPDGKSIKDSQIEDVQDIMAKKPYESQNTVIIIDKAETMTVRAQNRFLKTLEEPRGDSIVILLTINANSLLPTILSRCMVMKLKPVHRDTICNYLIEKYGIERKDAIVLAAFAYGNIGRAEQLHQSELFKENRIKCIKIAQQLSLIKEEDFYHIVHAIEELKDISSEFFDMLEFWYRDIILLRVKGNRDLIVNSDYMDVLLREADNIGYDKAAKIIYIIEEAKKDIKMNLNYNLVIKNMLLKIQEV